MRRHHSLVAAGIALGLALAWSTSSAADKKKKTSGKVAKRLYAALPVSDVVFPPQQIPLQFSHYVHLTKERLNCGMCHEDAADSKSSLDNLIPAEDTCEICHEIDRNDPDKKVDAGEPGAHCTLCHPGFQKGQPVARVVVPTPNIKFNHAVHVEKKIRCETCHGELVDEKVGLATRAQLPKMALCLQCHDGAQAPSECTTCHLSEAGGIMRTSFDSGFLKPSGVLRGADHDLMFRTSHNLAAKNDRAYCDNCHRKEFCVGCHNGTVKPMDFHGNDYVSLHPIDARRNTPDCSACHRRQTFCVGCHSRSGVAADNKGSEFNGQFTGDGARPAVLFHPSGWVGAGSSLISEVENRGPTHHSYEAQRNIRQCAACHRETFCTKCHSNDPSSLSINPHPAGWVGSRRCKALLAHAGRMCLRCHIDPVEVTCD